MTARVHTNGVIEAIFEFPSLSRDITEKQLQKYHFDGAKNGQS